MRCGDAKRAPGLVATGADGGTGTDVATVDPGDTVINVP